MGVKIGRNNLCPCGSGKKFKKCCIENLNKADDKEFLNPANFFENYNKLRRDSQIKQCLHPNKNECSEKIIKAHSIQNNKILNKISSNGIVYMPRPKGNNPLTIVTQYGRKEATVFTGFCGHHDKVLFQPIEDNLFNKSSEHIFLYTYRCFAVEYHRKQEVNKMGQITYTKKPSLLNLPIDENPYIGFNMAINDFEPVKEQFDKAIFNKNYDILTSIVWEFEQPVKFAGTGFEVLTEDLNGRILQNLLDMHEAMKHMFIMVFPEEDKTYCIISWLKENDILFSSYHEQLNQLTEQERKNYINNLLPMISENIVINPEAWGQWEEYKKNEFGTLLWGMADFGEILGFTWNRLESPIYDLFEL
jgi:hypothetical protein